MVGKGKRKNQGNTQTPPGSPSNLNSQPRKTSVREVNQESKQLSDRTTELLDVTGGVAGRATVATTLSEAELYSRVAWREPLPGEEVTAAAWTWQKKKKALERLLKGARGRVCSDEMETELSAIKQSSPSGGNRAQLITRLIALPPRSMVVAASCCGGPFSAEGTGSLVTMVGTMNETNFLRELVPQECQNHR